VPEIGLRDLSWGIEVADMDNDGLEDVVVAFGWLQDDHLGLENPELQPDALYLQRDDGTFAQVAETWGLAETGPSRGLALADLNQDGWLDVVKRDLWEDASFTASRCGEAHWLRLRLEQPGANSRAVGATARVEAGDRAWTRWIHAGGTSYASAGPLEAHFGLGEHAEVDRIVVTWPDGAVSEVLDVTVDRVGTVVRE